MKITVTLFFTIILTLSLFGQYMEKEEGLVSRFKPGIGWYYSGLKPNKEKKLRKYDRLIIDIVYNDWHGDQEIFESPWTSIGFNTSLMFDKVISDANTFSIGWGLSYSHVNNRTRQHFLRDIEESSTTVVPVDEASNVDRVKFSANYIELPLEFRFRTKGYKHFKFMIGGKIGYQLNAYTRTFFTYDQQKYNQKLYNFPDNNPLRYGATVRIGIRNWALFGAYYFSSMFTNQNSVQLTPLSVGVSISLF